MTTFIGVLPILILASHKPQAGRPTAYSCPVTLSFFRTNEKIEMKCLSLVVFEIFVKIAF